MAHHIAPWSTLVSKRTSRNLPLGGRCDSTCRKPNGNQAHCTVCGITTGTVRNFDLHRKNGWCINPEDLGMHLNAIGVWTFPMSQERREQLGILPGL